MTRLFVDYKIEENTEFALDKEDSRYISSVLRMREGEELTVVDGEGMEVLCKVEAAAKDEVILRAVTRHVNESESSCKITLYQSVSKGERMDLTIQKSVELGVYKIVPVFSSRCVVKPGKDSKIDRWQKIALEAARQCGRGIIPEVASPLSFKEALDAAKVSSLMILPWEEEKGQTLKQVIDGTSPESIAVFIGPEGGFSEEEAALAKEAGCKLVTLGKRILRTETAGPAVLAMLLYHNEL
ncbi:MAG: 16S rRNA (uracil(1498)-N(3))-methyltransferase [Saccharofermentans sp.]|nr:16S rRNA (uracil(1498)-N(3))-methyltransferase [Saccharofermentans sp.]